ncbi:hypothetical protein LTR37_011600 [Vermiconidia calcicola]|uniref:Uncharacterized protein n=1 Tax=Vermiconidia calcicola TaxID=1690605 RepID=A0ACC3N2A4_9PEZI|nr:hypothetical protein LTR37_011600 [Vermiconidia calcicola]
MSSDPKPRYETISYVWGDPGKRAFIKLDGRTVDVPASSAAAIRRMRLAEHPRALWIDAICINQSNVEEREQQVAMMGDIYRNSQGNLIYLGQDKDPVATEQALKDTKAVLEEMNEETDGLRLVKGTTFDPWRETIKWAETGLRCSREQILSASSILNLPWFRRLWVFQEAALATVNTCFLGRSKWNLLDTLRLARWLEHKRTYVDSAIFNDVVRVNASTLFEFVDKQHGQYGSGAFDYPPFWWLLNSCRATEVSDVSDKIYGMLGLRQWQYGIPHLLKPDYRKPSAHVLRDATRYALQEGEDGLVVWNNISSQSDEGLERSDSPSWVPDWNHARDGELDPPLFGFEIVRCSDGLRPKWEGWEGTLPGDPNVLGLYGFELCKIASLGLTLTTKVRDDFDAFNSWLVDSLALTEAVGGWQAACATLVAGTNAEGERATPEDCAALEDLKQLVQKEERYPMTLSKLQASKLAGDTYEHERRASRYDFVLTQACHNRRVFCTSSGHAGVGSKVLKEGDIIAALYGAENPFALRSSGEEYRLLGEYYVHGIMDGEATRKHKQEGKRDTLFRLR